MNHFKKIGIVGLLLVAPQLHSFARQTSYTYDASGNVSTIASTGGASPTIETQPQAGLFQTNGIVSFSVVATGAGLSYQWLSNGVAIVGATGDALSLSNLPATSSGNFSVVICNNSGCVTSTPVALYLDSRGVGMPDWWQMQYFGNLNQPPDGDYDGDGVNNLDEYLEGTNPTNAASYDPRLYVEAFNGTVEVTPLQPFYTMGQVVTLTAAPDAGSIFLGWSGGLDVLGNKSTNLSLAMNSHQSVTAFFALPVSSITWTNTNGGNWNVASNWSPNQVPNATNAAFITVPGTYIVTNNDNESVETLTLGGVSGTQTLSITGNGIFTLNDYGRGNSNAVFSVSGGSTVTPGYVSSITESNFITMGALFLSGPLDLTGGTINGIVEFNGGTIGGGGSLDGGQLINTGTVSWSGVLYTGNGSVISNQPGATINLAATNSAGASVTGALPGSSTFYNAGQITVAGAGAATISDTFNNSGTVSVNSGTLQLNGNGSENGVFTIASGCTLSLGAGTQTFNAGSSVSGPGNFLLTGATTTLAGTFNTTGTNTFDNHGTATINGNGAINGSTILVTSGGTVYFNNSAAVTPAVITVNGGGTLGGTSLIADSGALNLTGGTIAGVVEFNGGTIGGGGSLSGGQLINTGTVGWTGSFSTASGSIISNQAGATINLPADNSSSIGGPGTFYNAGQITVAGAGAATISDTFNNSGTVSVNSGTLQLNGNGSENGVFTIASGCTLSLGAGTQTFNAGSSVSGPGNFLLTGATTTLAGTFNTTGTNTFDNHGTATINGNGAINGSTILVTSGGTVYFNNSAAVTPAVITVNGGGTLGGTSLIADSGALNLTGGTIAGVVEFNGGTIGGGGSLSGGQLINTGTVGWTGSFSTASGSIISNQAGATINLPADNSSSIGGPGTFYNAGQITVAGAGAATISDTFNNSGTVSVNSGTLQLNGNNNLTFGTLNLGINSSTSYGKFTFAGAVALAGKLNATITNGFAPTNGSSFAILQYGSKTGVFGSTNLPANGSLWLVNYGTTATTLTVIAPPTIQTAKVSGSSLVFTWSASPTNIYQIQSATNLAPANWTNLGGSFTASNSIMTNSETIGTNSRQFYRIVLLP